MWLSIFMVFDENGRSDKKWPAAYGLTMDNGNLSMAGLHSRVHIENDLHKRKGYLCIFTYDSIEGIYRLSVACKDGKYGSPSVLIIPNSIPRNLFGETTIVDPATIVYISKDSTAPVYATIIEHGGSDSKAPPKT